MSIATEITRLQTAKADLKTAIEGKGVTVPSATLLDGYADLVESISGGGGTDLLAEKLNGTLTSYESDAVTKIFKQSFREYTPLTSLKCHNVVEIQNAAIYGNTGLTVLAFPKLNQDSAMQNCSNLTALDLGLTSSTNVQSKTGCSKLSVLIIRASEVRGLGAANNFNNTPFASGGTGGTLYVPSALISGYQAATNWSTILGYANNSIQAIEGSIYETQYADGTPIPTT